MKRNNYLAQHTAAAILFAIAFVALPTAEGQSPPANTLMIGTVNPSGAESDGKETGALETLESFIKDETGLHTTIRRQKDWREIVDKMDKGELKIGVFLGHEYAWAQEKQAKLKPLALGINTHRYRVLCVMTTKANSATKFEDLRGKSLSLPVQGQRLLRVFIDREAEAAGAPTTKFFSKVLTDQGMEEALDDLVDNVIQVAVVDRVALEAFKRRKIGRFNQLKEITCSQPLPPPVIAYRADLLDDATRQKFEKGILEAHKSERGQNVLTLFRVTSFETVPDDFSKVLADTRKTYPAPAK